MRVRKARAEYFASRGNDLDRMFDDLQRREAEHPERLAAPGGRLPGRKPASS